MTKLSTIMNYDCKTLDDFYAAYNAAYDYYVSIHPSANKYSDRPWRTPVGWDLADDLYELEDELREDPELWESINEILDNIHKLQKDLRELYIRTCVRQLYHGEWYFNVEYFVGWENFYRLIPQDSLFVDCGYQSDEISYNKAFERAIQIFEDSQNPDLYVDEKRGLILMALLARNGYEKAYTYAPMGWNDPILIE